jgi:hypothetical protein
MKSQQTVDLTWSILDRLGISLEGDAFIRAREATFWQLSIGLKEILECEKP